MTGKSDTHTVEKLKAEITRLQQCLSEKNRALDAMSWAWCSGGCASGMHRWCDTDLTEEMMEIAERGVGRMRQWLSSANFKVVWASMTPEERDEWMREHTPAKVKEEGTLEDKVTLALSEKASASKRRERGKNSAEETYNRNMRNVEAFLRDLKQKFKNIAFDIACEKNIPPHAENGYCLEPDDVDITPEGMTLIWNESDTFCSAQLTWKELEHEYQNRESNNHE